MSKLLDDYFEEGIHNYETGNIQGALSSFNKCVEISPTSYILTNRGLMNYILNHYSSAIDDFSKAIELDNTNSNAYYNRGLAYKESNKYNEALVDFNIVKTFNEDYPDIDSEIEMVKSYLSGKSLRLTLDMIQFDKDPAKDIFKRAQNKAASNLYKEAILDFDQAIIIDSNNSEYFYERGISKFQLKNYEGSKQDFLKSLELGNTQAKYMLDKSTKAILDNKTPFEKAVDLVTSEKWSEAIEVLDKLIEPFLSGDSNYMFLKAGVVYPIQQVYEAFYYRGYARFQTSDYANAIEDFDWVIGCNSNFSDALNWRGISKQQLKDYDGAIEDLSSAIKISPQQSSFFITRGMNYIHLGDKENAKKDWEKALELGDHVGQALIFKYI